MSRPKKIKTAIWIGEKQWASLKALADRLDKTAAQLVREAIDLLLKKYGAKGLVAPGSWQEIFQGPAAPPN